MTGRELIIYILENGLEDEPIFKDGRFIGFKTLLEVAGEMEVGVETVRVWCMLDMIQNVCLNGTYLIPANYKPPTESTK